MKIRNYQPRDFDFLKQMFSMVTYESTSLDFDNAPNLNIYYQNFGQGVYDYGQVITVNTGKPIGMIWCRLIKGYGYVQADLPELIMAIRPQFQHRGYGTQLLNSFLNLTNQHNFTGLSLCVNKTNNIAVQLYEKAGFERVKEQNQMLIMKLIF